MTSNPATRRRAAVTTMALRAGAMLAAAIALAGCSAALTPGKAVKAGGPDAPIVALMNTGAYTVTPSHPFGVVGDNAQRQNLMEAHRMAEFTVGPWEVDDALRMLPGVLES